MNNSLKVLVCYGSTRSYLDPVRYLSSYSSGKMGRALVAAGVQSGFEVSSLVVGLPLTHNYRPERVSNEAVLIDLKKKFIRFGI